jgi:mRNA-degrading endonuclease YafQ of YafQ-DinJ toxin-antitoxin module
MVKVLYSPKFKKAFRKVPVKIQVLVANKEQIFKKDPFYPTFKTHPLKGQLKGLFSFSINYQYRVLFRFREDKSVIFMNIGTHSIYNE